MSLSLFSSNTIVSDSGHGSQWVCIVTAASIGNLCSGWKTWFQKVQWLSAFMPGVQDSSPSVRTLVLWAQSTQGHHGSNPLPFWPCSLLKARGSLCFSPSLHQLTFDHLTSSYSEKKSLPTLHPLILLPLKTLCKVSSIHLRFYKRQEGPQSWSSSCFLLSFLYKFPLSVLFSSFRKLLKTLICEWPVPPILFALTFFLFFFNSTFDLGFRRNEEQTWYLFHPTRLFIC